MQIGFSLCPLFCKQLSGQMQNAKETLDYDKEYQDSQNLQYLNLYCTSDHFAHDSKFSSVESSTMDYDQILEELGQFSNWHCLQCCLLFLFPMTGSFASISFIFSGKLFENSYLLSNSSF